MRDYIGAVPNQTNVNFIIVLFSLSNFVGGITFSVMAPFYSAEATLRGISVTKSGVVIGSVYYATLLSCPLFGRFINVIGARQLLVYGLFLAGTTQVLFASLQFVYDAQAFFILSLSIRFVSAIGEAGYFNSIYPIANKMVPAKHRSGILGLLETMFGLGQFIGPFFGGLLFEFSGFYGPFLFCGSLLLICCFISANIMFGSVSNGGDSPLYNEISGGNSNYHSLSSTNSDEEINSGSKINLDDQSLHEIESNTTSFSKDGVAFKLPINSNIDTPTMPMYHSISPHYRQLLINVKILVGCCVLIVSELSASWYQPSLQPFAEMSFKSTPFEVGILFMLNGAAYALSSPIWGCLIDFLLSKQNNNSSHATTNGSRFKYYLLVIFLGNLFILCGYHMLGPVRYLSHLLPNSIYVTGAGTVVHGIGTGACMIAAFTLMLDETSVGGGERNEENDFQSVGMVTSLFLVCECIGGSIGATLGGYSFDTIGFVSSTYIVIGIDILLILVISITIIKT